MMDRFRVFYEFYKKYVFVKRREKFTPQEISELTNLSPSTVKSQIAFLQKKFMIRPYPKQNVTRYQLWTYATDAAEQIMTQVISKLRKSPNLAVKRVLREAKAMGYPKGYAHIIGYTGRSRRVILPVIYKISKRFFDNLKVFEKVTILPPWVYGNREYNLRIKGRISKTYRRSKGKFPITVFWPDESEHPEGGVIFRKEGKFDITITSKKNSDVGWYEVQITYQIFGDNPSTKYPTDEKYSAFYEVK